VNLKKRASTAKHLEAKQPPCTTPAHFSFGARGHGSGQARRLFVPQKGLLSPAFENCPERPRAILRMVSGPV
jgi:hypothetical protein